MESSTLAPLPPLPDLTSQLITISIIILQRTIRHNSITTTRPIAQNYDFIVVGAGTSGSVVAGRLSENSSVSVLVLEAGGPQTVTSDAPGNARLQYGTDIDWNYRTTPQVPNSGNAYDGRVFIPRGRIVGGSDNMNFMVYSRGNRHDFDSWANNFGATGWTYDEVLPYFLMSENNTDPAIVAAAPTYHSTSGPVEVQTPKNPDPVIGILKNALIEMGVPRADQNGPTQVGIEYFQQTIYLNNTRSTTASAYLEPYVNVRPNLQVLPSAYVRRILFNTTSGDSTNNNNGSNIQAIGVEYEHAGQVSQVYANREVIISAGAINSPQLLMLSGIGPRDHLNNLSIPTLVDLPVGHNFKDHVYVSIDFEVLDPSLITSGIDWSLENMYRYFVNAAGPLSQFPATYFYLNSAYNNETDWPDIQIDFSVAPLMDTLEELVGGYGEAQRDAWRDYWRDHVGERNHMVMNCFHFRPHSTGRVYLNSTNPNDRALIDARYLTDSYDIAALTDSIRRALQMAHMSPFNRMIRLYRQPIPGCQLCSSGPIWECASYLECYARALTSTVAHQVGTCKMGGNETDSVVDPRLRVRGVSGLRVIDASIQPQITNGNINAPSMMVGEYGAHMLRQDNSI